MIDDLIIGLVQASALTRARIDEEFESLVKRGILGQDEARRLADDLWARASAERERVGERLRESGRVVGETLSTALGLASREDHARLEARVAALEKRCRD